MNPICMRIAGLLAALGCVALSAAQSYSAFTATDGIYGVNVARSGLDYTVTIDTGAYFMLGGNHYDITDAFGFWSLGSTGSLSAGGADQGGWSWNEHSAGGGYIAGWTDNPKDVDIVPGQQMTFAYDSLNQANVEGYGFHFSTAQQINGGNTGYYKGDLNPVPEPTSLGALAVGVVTLIRKRRKTA